MASSIEEFYTEGYRVFQLKVGGEAFEDIARIRKCREILDNLTKGSKPIPLLCDANTGWLRHDALQVINGMEVLQ